MGDKWTECPAIPGTITVNLGDALMRWSGDKLKSNYHRVRMPQPGEDQGSRYSIAYFNQVCVEQDVQEAEKPLHCPLFCLTVTQQFKEE